MTYRYRLSPEWKRIPVMAMTRNAMARAIRETRARNPALARLMARRRREARDELDRYIQESMRDGNAG
jgi:hypothetical protein